MTSDAAALLAKADRALAAKDLAQARALLAEAAAAAPDDVTIPMKLAGLCRVSGQPRAALEAIHRALALAPLDFTALLMRASLLDSLRDASAGEAWGHALAQRPEGDLPPQLISVVAQGEARHAAWLDAREAEMRSAMAGAEARADADEARRIARFRSNALRRTRPYHSEPTHFHFPELTEREFHPRRLFPWLEGLEARTEAIAGELATLMAAERAELVPYIDYADHLPLRQWKQLNRNPDWSALHLLKNGKLIEANARYCAETLALLAQLPKPMIPGASPNAMFSLLAPRTTIPPHVGVSNARLVCHLPLIVPEGCWFRVGAETRLWQPGKAFVFDDTIEHEAMNPSGELRVVLIFDVWHPDLSAVEREAVAALIGMSGVAVDTGL
jgi:aspartyl/asparaginyl beta-hydroxylase (cupin superfamily)